jgi:hypothetical protein
LPLPERSRATAPAPSSKPQWPIRPRASEGAPPPSPWTRPRTTTATRTTAATPAAAITQGAIRAGGAGGRRGIAPSSTARTRDTARSRTSAATAGAGRSTSSRSAAGAGIESGSLRRRISTARAKDLRASRSRLYPVNSGTRNSAAISAMLRPSRSCITRTARWRSDSRASAPSTRRRARAEATCSSGSGRSSRGSSASRGHQRRLRLWCSCATLKAMPASQARSGRSGSKSPRRRHITRKTSWARSSASRSLTPCRRSARST